MTTEARCWNELATENVALRAHIAKARATITVLAGALGSDDFDDEKAAKVMVREWVDADKASGFRSNGFYVGSE